MINESTDKLEALMEMSSEYVDLMEQFLPARCRYQAAIREMQTKLQILDNEYQLMNSRNPIHHMDCRLKSIASIAEKLKRRDLPVSIDSAMENLTDIAGVRVICSYIEDVYTVASLLARQDDLQVLRVHDYIESPKENGYRSLHLIVQVPVFLQNGKVPVPVEVQIRTIAMDLWASLEHHLRYKGMGAVTNDISAELQTAAEDIAAIDKRMQDIHRRVEGLKPDQQYDT